jgi:predicted ester cyclase
MSRAFAVIVLAAASTATLAQNPIRIRKDVPVTTSKELTSHKQIITELFEQCFNKGQVELLPKLVDPTYPGPNGQSGPSVFSGMIASLRTTMPDLHYTLEDLVAESDRVAVRWGIEGTQDGPFQGFPPSHKHVTSTGMAIFQFKDNKIVASWLQLDQLGFLQKIDALPNPLQPPQ